MAGSWDSGVSGPSGASYLAPLMNFSSFGNWANDYQQGGLNAQQKQLNDQAIKRQQQQAEIAQTFAGGLPIDPKTGQPDYAKAVAMLAQKGDINAIWNGADAMAVQSAGNLSPLLGPGAQPQQPQQPPPQQGAAPPGAQPASLPARPMSPPIAGGGDHTGSVMARVTDALPGSSDKIGLVATNIARSVGVDPNAALTPDQAAVVDARLQNYLKRNNLTPQGGAAPQTRIASAFAALPPSAAAGTPGVAAQPAGGPAPQQAPPQAPPQAAPAPAAQPQAGGPITPQVPLPPGFTDPQAAILALRREAARMSANPRAGGQVKELNDYAARIEASIQPVKLGQYDTYVDPQSKQVIAEGPGAAAIRATETAGRSPTLDADAERYRQTGQLPPNMGRGLQGAAEARMIRQRATDLEMGAGGDPATWPSRWQDFKASGVGKNTAERTRAGREENLNLILKATDAAIPAALEASKNLPRGQYVPLNKLIQKGEIMSSDPRLVEFGMANLQLAEHWARAMNPTGVMRESDRDKALSFLDTAYGSNTYDRAVMQLQKQITRERDAVKGGGTITKEGKAPAPGEEPKAGKDGWTDVGNGVRIREVN